MVAVLLVGLLSLIWGSTWLVIRESLTDLPPFLSAATRFTVAGFLMIVVCAILSRREGGDSAPLWLVGVTGTLNFAGSYGIVYWAEEVLPSALTSILWAVYPLFVAVAGHLMLPAERVSPRQALGFLIGFVGVVVLFATDVQDLGPGAVQRSLVLLISPLIVAVSTVLIKRHGVNVSSLRLNRDAMLLGAALLWLVAWRLEDFGDAVWTRRAILSVGYLSAIGTVLTFSVLFWLLRYAPANKLSVIPYASPVVAVLLGVLIAGESLTRMAPVGLVLIFVGIVLVTKTSRRRAPVARAAS